MADRTRLLNQVLEDLFNDEGISTNTSEEQISTEAKIQRLLEVFESASDYHPELPRLYTSKHLEYLRKSLTHLSSGYQCLDCSRPWLCYWTLHALHLLGEVFSCQVITEVSDFLSRCQNADGGFGGGPGQLSHLAPTYAAVCALITLGDEIAFKVIDREALVRFLHSVKSSNGSFAMHVGGEVDIRGVYCAVSVALMTNVFSDQLFSNTAEWVASCQTYEGGFSGCPGMEAHGGYTFCGMAALVLLGKPALCDAKALLRWSVNRQMRFEGGFQGRPNKLVDSCYSFWQAGVFPILHSLLAQDDPQLLQESRWLFHQEALQEYILIACQYPSGGLVDKPYKERDLYHTCYALSGLSTSQRSRDKVVIGVQENLMRETHSLFNVGTEQIARSREFYSKFHVPLPPEIS